MSPRGGRISAVSVLVVVVLLLVPALAWLQYRWVGQVSEAERERMQRTLRTSALQFATDVDSELSRALAGLQVEGGTVRSGAWVSYAQRYSSWIERGGDARLVREVLLVDVPPSAGARERGRRSGSRGDETVSADRLRVRRWDNDRRIFADAAWTPDLAVLRAPLADHLGNVQLMRGQQGPGRFRREGSLSLAIGDDYTLVAPVTHFEFDDNHRTPPRIEVLGFTLVRLDPTFILETLLPALTARHFQGEDGLADYRVAVTDRRDPSRVVWESEPGAAAATRDRADVEASFMSPRPDQLFMLARTDGGGRGGPRGGRTTPPDGRIVISVLQDRRTSPADAEPGRGPFEGRWRIAAMHRAGSLDAAVAAVRTRNLLLSSGILVLLTMAIGLIVVSARRSQALARQQMEFVAAVSHELRTPVAVIGTAASNLADGVVADPARVRKYGETIQGEARRLGETVERVLQLAGIAAGSLAAARSAVPVDGLVQQSIAACRPEIEARGVTVEVHLADRLPAVHGDAGALGSAVRNLISNAVKYGGDSRWLRVEANATGARQVAITVTDRGIGIDAADRGRIFEPFYRGREAVARQIQGSGLGLNLVARIAEAHGGRVEVQSEPGHGSAFTLVLPASTAGGSTDAVPTTRADADSTVPANAHQITS